MTVPEKRSAPYNRHPRRSKFWVEARYVAYAHLSRFPRLLRISKLVSRTARLLSRECKKNLALFKGLLRGGYEGAGDVDRVCVVDPRSIVYCTLSEFLAADFKGRVTDGDWDLLEKQFQDLDICVAFKQVIEEGKDWPDTVFYQRTLESLERGDILWGCRSKEELDQRCRELVRLFRTIQAEGYKSQREIHGPSRWKYYLYREEEVCVSIGRYGDLLYCDGAHRLAIAKLLGLTAMPVEVVVRHPEWFRFRKQLLRYIRRHNGFADQLLLHPDLKHFPARGDSETLFSMITKNLSVKGGLLLDVNARFGFFCHKFEEQGFQCLALEDSEELIYFLERLRRAGNKKFRILKGGEEKEITHRHFNVVLALDLDHDSARSERSAIRHVDFLKTLWTDELFVMRSQARHSLTAPGGNGPDPIQSLKTSPRFKEMKCIGALGNGSVLYKFIADKKVTGPTERP